MRKRLVILVVVGIVALGLVAGVALASCGGSATPTTTAGGPTTSQQSESTLAPTTTTLADILPAVSTVRYENQKFGFSIGRPASSPAKTQGFEAYLPLTQAPVVGFTLTPEIFQGTNLLDAGVYIGASSDAAVAEKWNQPVADSGEKMAGTVEINELSFAVFTSNEAAAGNIYEKKIYRTLRDGTCFEIVELLQSGNIGNYDKGTVVEFDKAKFEGYLEAMVKTFAF